MEGTISAWFKAQPKEQPPFGRSPLFEDVLTITWQGGGHGTPTDSYVRTDSYSKKTHLAKPSIQIRSGSAWACFFLMSPLISCDMSYGNARPAGQRKKVKKKLRHSHGHFLQGSPQRTWDVQRGFWGATLWDVLQVPCLFPNGAWTAINVHRTDVQQRDNPGSRLLAASRCRVLRVHITIPTVGMVATYFAFCSFG